MSVELEQVQQIEDTPLFHNRQGVIPLWDHPHVEGHKVLPKDYKPMIKTEAVLSLYFRRIIKDEDIMILKVIGDAVCCNEDQIRRYLSSQLSRSVVSKRLEQFRKYGLVDRWKVRISTDLEENIKPPAPFTLGIAGFKLLKHFYNSDFFMDPNRWDTLGIATVQRYVALNELRCSLIEAKVSRRWKWNASIANNKRLKTVSGFGELETPEGNLNILVERAQMSQNFIGFLRDKLNLWKLAFDKYGTIPVDKANPNQTLVLISASSLSIAEKLQKELLLDTFPFTIWITVEENMLEDGLETSFYAPSEQGLHRLQLDFLKKK